MGLDVRQLRYFVGIVEHGSFSKAATRLNVAQPALSQHVRHMEEELGVELLHRGTQGVIPTEAGNRLVLHARTILAEMAQLHDSVRECETTPRGEVRFGLPGTVGEILGVPMIEEARRLFPGVRIRIVEAMSGYILDWLRRGDVDLGIIYGVADPKGLACHHRLSEELCLFSHPDLARVRAAPGGGVTLAEAAALDLILPGLSHGLRHVIERAALAADVTIEPAIEIDSYSNIKRLVRRGLGYGILPVMAVQQEASAGLLSTWRFVEPVLERKVYLAYSTERPLSFAVRAIGSLAWTKLRQLVQEETWTATLSDESNRPAFCLERPALSG
jgi:LysR family transcriptional regulator, nitrogen assimilation regulatory protein